MNQLMLEHLTTIRQADLRAEAARDRLARSAALGSEDVDASRLRRLIDSIRTRFGGLGDLGRHAPSTSHGAA